MMELKNKTGLLIDDNNEMRTALRIQLTDCGLQNCQSARNIREAVERLENEKFDLIVCDYNLGQGADGQQFLELVRRKQLLPLSTAFMMVTGETGYQQVSTAAEFSPDDYLLKPFTSETLANRLLRVLEKKDALRPIYQHMHAKGDKQKALAACEALLAAGTCYQADVLRLQGELLLQLDQAEAALALYENVLAERATPWALVGKAQAQQALGKSQEAVALLQEALTTYPNYLVAYDLLADSLAKTDVAAAQAVVERALKVSASTKRQREIGELALENGDYARAEQAFNTAVERDRTGFFKSHDDYAALARSRNEQGKHKEALDAIKNMGQHFANNTDLKVRQAALEAQTHVRAGNLQQAEAAYSKAMLLQAEGGLSAASSLELAQSCFALGQSEQAQQIIRDVAENHHEDAQIIKRAQNVFAAAGLKEEGEALLDQACKAMIRLNNDAVTLAKSGQLDQAINMLVEAADRLHNNAQVSINAAQAILMRIAQRGPNGQQLEAARHYIEQAMQANPAHSKLPTALAYYAKVAPSGTPPIRQVA